MTQAFCVWLGLALGNFLFQAALAQDWALAFDRSYWQFVACMTLAFVARRDPR